jgi:uncharacterized protein (UPF0335 family)
MQKREIQHRVKEILLESDKDMFNDKFQKAWIRMRKMKEITKVSKDDIPAYKLAQDD